MDSIQLRDYLLFSLKKKNTVPLDVYGNEKWLVYLNNIWKCGKFSYRESDIRIWHILRAWLDAKSGTGELQSDKFIQMTSYISVSKGLF